MKKKTNRTKMERLTRFVVWFMLIAMLGGVIISAIYSIAMNLN